ncbi:hypothetical protein BD289DRAFT_503673 [Coniella lustricola]|uniref:Uncharacterized protein n=1 Tax=Coniella lustricola TaxID=2025994 RepID=A0A2T3AGV3_9PEZI|nr:hypothetical protein BD289DRAFT_503673 [Coniella lustricola]
MPKKRTRSSVRQEHSDSYSSNVTDYLGSSKWKRTKGSDDPQETPAVSVADLSIEVAEERANSTPRDTNDDDGDDDDGPIEVNFKEVISVSNEARYGQKTYGARAQTNKDYATFHIKNPGRNVGANKNGHSQETRSDPSAMLRLQQVRKTNEAAIEYEARQNQSIYDYTGSSESSLSDIADTIRGRSLERQKPAVQALPPRIHAHSKPKHNRTHQECHDMTSPIRDVRTEQAPSNNKDNSEETGSFTAEDSAFIEAPQRHTTGADVQVAIHSLRAIFKTLAHQAWTQKRKWNEGSNLSCNYRPAQTLWKLVERLIELLEKSTVVRDKQDTNEAYGLTIKFLKSHDREVKKLFASISREVEDIVSKKLAPREDLNADVIKQRRLWLRSISRSLIPILVILIEHICDLVPSEKSGSSVRLQFSAFTLQFFLRTVGWTMRLERGLDRGLKVWPFEREFRASEEKLDQQEVTIKASKIQARELFHKQLSALYSSAKRAESKLQDVLRKLALDREELEAERRMMIERREMQIAKQREEELATRQSAVQWEAFCKSTQALRDAPNPLKEKWDRAQRHPRMRAANSSVHGVHGVPRGGSHIRRAGSENDPFADDNEDQDAYARNNRASTHTRLQRGSAGQDWDQEEEQLLCQALRRYAYDTASMAERLRRTENDVAHKAAIFKSFSTRPGGDACYATTSIITVSLKGDVVSSAKPTFEMHDHLKRWPL